MHNAPHRTTSWKTALAPDGTDVLALLHECATEVCRRITALDDWSAPGRRPGQYAVDLVADEAVVGVLQREGITVLSEESGRHPGDGSLTVVVDPIDGSGNAVRALPPFGPSLCAVDTSGATAALVVDVLTGTRFEAEQGRGARRDGIPISVTDCDRLDAALLAVSGPPPRALDPGRYRNYSAAALELCFVASGMVDGYLDCDDDVHAAWDYLAGALICIEAGGVVIDARGRDLVALGEGERRTPIAASTRGLVEQMLRLVR